MTAHPIPRIVRQEWFLAVGVVTAAIFLTKGSVLFDALATPLGMGGLFAWLFVVILGSALNVVRHAAQLAQRLGEPSGTLILTLAVASIEVISLSAVILHGGSDPTLVRDSLMSVVMIILNGMVGLSLLIGAWRHREQQYNLQGANIYLGVIIPLVVLSLVLPSFTTTTPGPTLAFEQSIFLILASLGLYGAFLAMQTGRHRGYFIEDLGDAGEAGEAEGAARRPTWQHAMLLLAYMVPDVLGRPVDFFIETLDAPTAIGGLALALLVATPEAIGAVRAATQNHLQRAV